MQISICSFQIQEVNTSSTVNEYSYMELIYGSMWVVLRADTFLLMEDVSTHGFLPTDLEGEEKKTD